MAKKSGSRDQQRKAKLTKRKQKVQARESLAYFGTKYQTDKLAPLWISIEIPIYEYYEVSDRRLTDRTVHAAITSMIHQARSGQLQLTAPVETSLKPLNIEEGNDVDALSHMIVHSLQEDYDGKALPPREQLIGVLRSILGSIENVSSGTATSQAYLRHISSFLKNEMGVSIQILTENGVDSPMSEEDPFLILCREMISSKDAHLYQEVINVANDLIDDHQEDRVIETCQLVMAGSSSLRDPRVAVLVSLLSRAHHSLEKREEKILFES